MDTFSRKEAICPPRRLIRRPDPVSRQGWKVETIEHGSYFPYRKSGQEYRSTGALYGKDNWKNGLLNDFYPLISGASYAVEQVRKIKFNKWKWAGAGAVAALAAGCSLDINDLQASLSSAHVMVQGSVDVLQSVSDQSVSVDPKAVKIAGEGALAALLSLGFFGMLMKAEEIDAPLSEKYRRSKARRQKFA